MRDIEPVPLSLDQLNTLGDALSADPAAAIAQAAATTNGLYAAARNNAVAEAGVGTFSLELPTGKVTNQRKSGRCWLFATLNTVRHRLEAELGVENLELSETYTYFFDKLEKAGAFAQRILETAGRDLDDREVHQLLTHPQGDGGWWDWAATLIRKYGTVPARVMPEAAATRDSGEFNDVLNRRLRAGALTLRQAASQGAEAIAAAREALLADVYRICTIALGTPPREFEFAYRDKDKAYHRETGLTPVAFAARYAGPLDHVTLANDPRHPYWRLITAEHTAASVGAPDVTVLNVPMADLKTACLAQLRAGEGVWYGCDVGSSSYRKTGVMDLTVLDVDRLLGVDLELTKAQLLDTFGAEPTHAMTLVGADLDGETPRHWKVENSWGEDAGDKGYFTMSDAWFDLYGFEAVIRRDLLTPEMLAAFDEPAITVPSWSNFVGRPLA